MKLVKKKFTRGFQSDNIVKLMNDVKAFYYANPDVKRQDFIKTYFNSIAITGIHGETVRVQHHGFLAYEKYVMEDNEDTINDETEEINEEGEPRGEIYEQ